MNIKEMNEKYKTIVEELKMDIEEMNERYIRITIDQLIETYKTIIGKSNEAEEMLERLQYEHNTAKEQKGSIETINIWKVKIREWKKEIVKLDRQYKRVIKRLREISKMYESERALIESHIGKSN